MNIHIDTTTAILRAAQSESGVRIDFDRDILILANHNAKEAIQDPVGPADFLKDLFARNEIVFAILPHPTERGALTSEVLKGAGLVRRVIAGEERDVQMTGWHCRDAAEAARIRAAFSRDSHYDRDRLAKIWSRVQFKMSDAEGSPTQSVPAFLRDLCELANGNLIEAKRARVTGVDEDDYYRGVFASAKVVALVYRDRQNPCGVSYMLAKGASLGLDCPDRTALSVRDQDGAMRIMLKYGEATNQRPA